MFLEIILHISPEQSGLYLGSKSTDRFVAFKLVREQNSLGQHSGLVI